MGPWAWENPPFGECIPDLVCPFSFVCRGGISQCVLHQYIIVRIVEVLKGNARPERCEPPKMFRSTSAVFSNIDTIVKSYCPTYVFLTRRIFLLNPFQPSLQWYTREMSSGFPLASRCRRYCGHPRVGMDIR